ncbi:MAG TPA: hypothetical protein VK914_05925 [bacterium]|nr:hypothetical protein [bacterium]
MPSVIAAGPGGGAVMEHMVQRKFSIWMTVGALGSVLTGLTLISIEAMNSPAWLWSAEGICLELGGLMALGAFGIGIRVQKPMVERMAAIAAEARANGGQLTDQQKADLGVARTRMARGARVASYQLLAAAVLMGVHGLVAQMALR